jgi:hypothetical protein
MNSTKDSSGGFGPLIYAYTRAQAIEDGVLIDASDMAREAGFRFPVALTTEAFARYVRVPDGVTGQDQRGRLWDILWMLRCAVRASPGHDPSELLFQLYVRNEESSPPELVTLKALCGYGDDSEPVLTVMLPDED